MPTPDDLRAGGTQDEAETRNEPGAKLLSFPDAGMRSNRKVDSQRLALAVEMFEDRRARGEVFGDTAMFGEGAWDILLALYVAEHREDYHSASRLMLASEEPLSTRQRWIGYLESVGYIARAPQGAPLTMETLKLLPKGVTALNTYFNQVLDRREKN
jgi:hypothetical protein